MCILASRQHTCVHPEVSKAKNKNDECKKLLDGLDLEVAVTGAHIVQGHIHTLGECSFSVFVHERAVPISQSLQCS